MAIKWNKQLIIEKAQSCATKKEFTQSYGGAYNAAKRLGIFEEVCTYFSSSNKHWTIEDIQKEALKYSTKKEFKTNSRGAYEAAVRKGISNFTQHMTPIRKSWTLEKARQEALKFNYRGDFAKFSSGAYHFLANSNYLESACKHMWTSEESIKWTPETISREAKKYNSRNQFKLNSSGAYQAMLKLDITDFICSHMDPPKCIKYTYEELSAEALKYTTKSEFKRNSYGHYQAACRHTNFELMTKHMKDASKFSMFKPSILYYFRILLNGNLIWKIGVTNYSVEDRYYRRDIDRMEEIQEWKFNTGAEAYNAEQTIINLFKEYKYIGPTPFTDGTGTTECFYKDISNSDLFITLRDCDDLGNPLE